MATAMDRPPPIQNAALAASAGTGKTFALSNRYLALLAAGADPASIAALTFTRKAAGEILARILSRLAAAAASPAQARLLQDQLAQAGLPGFADQAAIQQALRRLAHALPRLHIGTLDSFFLQILKPFRLEYGIGVDIQIRQEATSAEEHPVLQHILDRVHLSAEEQAELMEVFKHSTFGEEAKSVYTSIRNLIHHQFELFQRAPDATHWGNPARIWPDTGGRLLQPPPTVSWEMVRSAVEQQKQAARTETERKNWDALLENFLSVEQGADYTLDHAFFKNLYRLFAQPTEEARSVRIGNAKPVALLEETRKALTEAFGAIRHLFLLKHIIRTHGLHGLLRTYAAGHWEHAAQTGHLSFQDVAHLLSPSSRRVPPHLRAQLDFRLDARFQHWLLDEFQDTSLVQWSVLENLMDEILQNPSGEHTLFYVGDTKQAIYEWRAGDPRLFHRILNKYNRPGRPPVIEEAPPLTRSWRSAPVILETLNTVFGRLDQVSPKTTELLEDWTHVVRLWMQEWTPHEAAESNHSLLGHAALYCLPPDDGEEPGGSRLQTLELLRQLQRQVPMFSRYSVAILTRSNKEGLRLRDFLAAEGIRTAWAGNSPLLDNALIPAVLSFAKLIEHPGDTLARRHVDMSLLAPLLPSAAPLSCRTLAAWGRLIREEGYAGFCAELASRLNLTHAPLEAGRLHSLMTLALEFDRRSAPTALQFLSFVETQELPGLQTGSNIHILTMHKSKGLEYDVVILPALGEKGITANAKKDVLLQEEGTHEPIPPVNWILSSPETSVIQADPTLGGRLAQDRRHRALEELRLLYVAMTRAKRALYLLTSAPSKTAASLRLETLLQETLTEADASSLEPSTLPVWEAGKPEWWMQELPSSPVELPEASPPLDSVLEAAEPVEFPLQSRLASQEEAAAATGSGRFFHPEGAAARRLGTRVHALLEQIVWLKPGELPVFPHAEEGLQDLLRQMLVQPSLHRLFEKPAGWEVELLQEQPFEVVVEGKWISGQLDRLHLERDASGAVRAAHILDYKTDRAPDPERHRAQMMDYRLATARLFQLKPEQIRCTLLFVRAACAEEILPGRG